MREHVESITLRPLTALAFLDLKARHVTSTSMIVPLLLVHCTQTVLIKSMDMSASVINPTLESIAKQVTITNLSDEKS